MLKPNEVQKQAKNKENEILRFRSVLEAVSVCPVAFEIYERLKEEYGFRKKIRR